MDIDPTISADDLQEIDAAYSPFPPAQAWLAYLSTSAAWDESKRRLAKAAAAATDGALSKAVEMVMRAAAIDTGAIEGLYSTSEGLTVTVATQATAWQAALSAHGANVRALFEAQLSAYQLVLDAATRSIPISEAWIRRLHEEVCSPQATYQVITATGPQEVPLPKGHYKQHPNHVRLLNGTVHSYAPVQQVAPEMHRLIQALQSDDFEQAHPVAQAAFVHHALVCIHPFADGNGRVARALASTFLYRDARIPLLIFADRKADYLAALRAADARDFAPFTAFVLECSLSALNLTAETLLTASAPRPQAELEALGTLLVAQGDLTHVGLDRLGQTVKNILHDTFRERRAALALPRGVNFQMDWYAGSSVPEHRPDFRHFGDRHHLGLSVVMSPPADARARAELVVLVSRGKDMAQTVLIWSPSLGGEELMFALRDVHPSVTMAAAERLRALADRVMGNLFASVRPDVTAALRNAGYFTD